LFKSYRGYRMRLTDIYQAMVETGMARMHSGEDPDSMDSDEPLQQLVEECKQAGVELLA
jgi:hypothetical protein